MMVGGRTPVLVGYGQTNQRDEVAKDIDPVALMAEAARRAAGPEVLRAADAIQVVNLLSWRYRDPGLLLAQHIGAAKARTYYSGVGGNVPQTLVNHACSVIQRGGADVVVLAGAECWHTRMRLRARGIKPEWPRQDASVASAPAEADVPLGGPAEKRIGLDRPAYVYPLFEQAIRIAAGAATEEHRRGIGQLWSRFSAVAEDNPHAWSRQRLSAEQIWRESPTNRMISWPYTKLLNANNMVNQAAVLVLASAQAAARWHIPLEQWVFPYAGADAHDTYAIAQRGDLHRSPAIRIAGRRALELAGIGVDDVDLVDLYSCFPSAVQIAANELDLPIADAARPLTVTGGLTFAGGPWNNYVMHSIATMAEKLIAQPGIRGLITANGGYLTKHSFGVYGTQPPLSEFRWEDVQSEVDREPTRTAVSDWNGVGAVESWTAPFSRDGEPEKVLLAVRTPDGGRTLAAITDASVALATVDHDIAGAPVRVYPDATAALL